MLQLRVLMPRLKLLELNLEELEMLLSSFLDLPKYMPKFKYPTAFRYDPSYSLNQIDYVYLLIQKRGTKKFIFLVPLLVLKDHNQLIINLICGGRGIRTPGAAKPNGFQDRRDRPLCHPSSALNDLFPVESDAKVLIFLISPNLWPRILLNIVFLQHLHR